LLSVDKKNNFSGWFKLEPITTYPPIICFENVVDVTLLLNNWYLEKY